MNDSKVQTIAGRKMPPNAGKGRRKGVPNRTTAALKVALLEAFDEAGGVDWLVQLAKSEPRIFVSLLSKLVPQEQADADDKEMVITVVGGFTNDDAPPRRDDDEV